MMSQEQDTRKRAIRTATRLFISLALLILSFNYEKLLNVLNIDISAGKTAVHFLMVFVRLILIYIILLSLYILLFTLTDNLPKKKKRSDHAAVPFEISKILYVLSVEPIIDIEIRTDDDTVHIGSSSDCKMTGNNFFDKKYYIDSALYDSVDAVSEYLYKISSDGARVDLLAVDDVNDPLNMLHYDFDNVELPEH